MLKRSYVPPLAVADASVGKKDRSNRDGATLLPQHFCHFLLLPPPPFASSKRCHADD